MQTMFDGTAVPYGIEPFSLTGLVALGLWAYERFVRKERGSYMLLFMASFLLIGVNAIKNWDQWRVAHMVQSGDGVHITRGAITQHWSIAWRKPDVSGPKGAYRTVVSEGFDIGAERFSWNRGDSFSPATFSNTDDAGIALADGQMAEVTWFVDEAANDERRIVRLRLGPAIDRSSNYN
ncbi:MAG: hypothetical protein ACRCY3_03090 [Sphingorhabdus sp.]